MKDRMCYYYKLSDDEKEIVKKVQKRTITEYDIQNDFINVEHIMYMVEDLLNEIDRLEEELEEEIQDKNDNYRRLSYSEMGWN
jgi:ubiquinone/menaquinone biosynthesis C-methylase UbiE